MKLKPYIASVVIATNVTSTAFAQEAEPTATLLPAVVVSTTSDSETYLDTPVRVDVISAEEIEKDHNRFLGDTLQKVPGVVIREVDPLVPALGIRMPANFNAPYYLATIDQIPMSSAVSINHATAANLPISTATGGMEILRGATSVLYGADAISAVIDLKTPEFADRKSLALEGGQRGFGKVLLTGTGKVTDTQEYYAVGNYTHDDGWRDMQRMDRGETILKHRVKISDTSKVTTTIVANKNEGQGAGYLDYNTYQNDPTNSGITATDDTNSDSSYIRLTSEWRKSIDAKNEVIVTPYLRHTDSDYKAYWYADTLPTITANDSTFGANFIYSHIWTDSETKVGLALETTKYKYKEVQELPTYTGGFPPSESPRGTHYDYDVNYLNISPFIAHTWSITEQWRWDLGLRADFSNYDYKNNTSNGDCDSPNNTNGLCGAYLRVGDRTDKFDGISPKTGVNYLISKNQAMFFNVGMGYKIPNAQTLYNLTDGQASPNLSGEKSYTSELGYKSDNGTVGLELSVYNIDIHDRVVRTYGSTVSTYENAGKSRSTGVELGAAWKASEELKLQVAANYNESRFIDYKSGGTDYSGHKEAKAPSEIYDVVLTYRPTALRGFETSLEWNRTGSYWVEDANQHLQAGHDVFNWRGEYQYTKDLSFNARVMNLMNTKYPIDVANYGSLVYKPAMPFTAYIGLGYAL
ncbi:TonB-dependent receptor [Bdellovibrio sp. HCB288]|uniref:TonB-dependent receptor n=1 Tax=Bdellovibrio sp. HCB288 TaxID=3394355 RepID=UPI0039B3D9D0